MKKDSRWRIARTAVLCSAVALEMLCLVRTTAGQTTHFDFGVAGTEPGYVSVGSATTYPTGSGYGWLSTSDLQNRDRGGPDVLHRDFVIRLSAGSNAFRVSGLTANGKYLMKVTCGDASYGDHVITVGVPGAGTLPTMSPNTSQYLTLNASVDADAAGILDITFASPVNNWVVNAITLEPATSNITPYIDSSFYFNSTWDPAVFATDPTTNLLAGFDGTGAVGFAPTALTSNDYLTLVASEIDYFVNYQVANGAIVDPYAGSEIQYSTPAFANAAAVLVVYAGRSDLLEPAAKAMDRASYDLGHNAAASSHPDFYAPMLAHAYRLLSPLVSPSRKATWETNLDFDPYAIYRADLNDFNWNMIASSGEALYQIMGLRSSDSPYVDDSWARQGHHFSTPYGLYMEGPMCYDIFPRVFLTDAIEQGYTGSYNAEMSEAMDRAAISSLFMQSPWGELPSGQRSAHHQWNEAEQCLLFEIYAGKAKLGGNMLMAEAYKRAAHLSLASMQRWVRPSGEMQIVKNWVDPASRHGYQSYSFHSQYNLLPTMMLATAYEYALLSDDVVEGPAPSDTGGFVFQIDRTDTPARPHKIFANAGGTYVEIESFADNHYDAQGLVRVHLPGLPPQLGPTESLVSSAEYTSPDPSPVTTGVGVSWLDSNGTTWRTLGEMGDEVTSVTLTPVSQTTTSVVFDVTYAGSLPNVTGITEHYTVTPAGVQLTTELAGYSGALRYVWPVHSDDGITQSVIGVDGSTVSVSKGGAAATYTAVGANSVSVGNDEYSNRNGWARLGIAEYPVGGNITLLISRQEPDVNILFKSPTGNIYETSPTLEVVMEDGNVTVDTNQVVLLLDGAPVPADSLFKVGATTTVSYTSLPLSIGLHTAGVVAGPSPRTNEWIFSIVPLPVVPLGDITYVDASSGGSGNTMQWNGTSWVTFNPPTDISSTADDQWEEETAYGANGPTQNWFESNREPTSGPEENCPQLRTMITGLADQTYAVFAYFWVASGQGFKFGAALTNNPTGSLPLYSVGNTGVTAVNTDNFANAVDAVVGDRMLYQVSLGTVTGTHVAVYIDDEANGGYSSSCWYDGIGYQPVASMTSENLSVGVTNDWITLSWPATHKGWMLQSRSSLTNTWEDVGGSASYTSWSIPGNNTNEAEFFRIRYPLP